MDKRRVIYYRSEQEEFSTAKITPKKIDKDYRYDRGSFPERVARFFWYRIVATPLAFLYTKIKFGHRTVNRKAFKGFYKKGFFIYGNHTQDISDPLMPNVFMFPKDVYFIVHPNNVSMPYLGRINPYLGAIPLPDDMQAYRNFLLFIEKQIEKNNAVAIYPEAHIWPYYTGIRNFPDASFGYPVRLDAPVFCFTNTYHRRRFRREPRIVTYIDGPFYPDKDLPPKKRARELRDRVYAAMCERAKNSDIRIIEYIKKEEQQDLGEPL